MWGAHGRGVSHGWRRAQWSFAGWVPNIAGQLSFSLIGAGVVNALSARGWAKPDVQAVAAIQRRVAGDLPWPRIIRDLSWARTDFVVIASTTPCFRPLANPDGGAPTTVFDVQGRLAGTIFLLQKHEGAQHRRLIQLRKDIRRRIARRSTLKWLSPLLIKVEGRIRRARKARNGIAGLVIPEAKFTLDRSGEFRIWCERDQIPHLFSAEIASDSPEAQVNAAGEFASDFCQHAFYFIRDLTHRHYHHAPTSDSLLPLCPVHRFDDVTWRRETKYALARAVLEARRDDDLLRLKHAEGIAAYARAFQTCLGLLRRTAGCFDEHEENHLVGGYDWANLMGSVSARTTELELGQAWRAQVYGLIVSVLIAVGALWFSAAQVRGDENLSSDPLATDSLFKQLAALLYLYPSASIVIITFAAGLCFWFLLRGVKTFGWVRPWYSFISKLLLAIGGSISIRLRRSFLPRRADGVTAAALGSLMALLSFASLDFGAGTANGKPLSFPMTNAAAKWLIHSTENATERVYDWIDSATTNTLARASTTAPAE